MKMFSKQTQKQTEFDITKCITMRVAILQVYITGVCVYIESKKSRKRQLDTEIGRDIRRGTKKCV